MCARIYPCVLKPNKMISSIQLQFSIELRSISPQENIFEKCLHSNADQYLIIVWRHFVIYSYQFLHFVFRSLVLRSRKHAASAKKVRHAQILVYRSQFFAFYSVR